MLCREWRNTDKTPAQYTREKKEQQTHLINCA